MCVATIADKYLALGMQDLAKRFKLKPTVAAVTLIAFANGAPDVLASFSNSTQEDGGLISLGSLFGAFIFSTTLVVANVVFNSVGFIVIPEMPLTKELGFYLISVIICIFFGFIRKSGYGFVITYLVCYVVYIVVTIMIEK